MLGAIWHQYTEDPDFIFNKLRIPGKATILITSDNFGADFLGSTQPALADYFKVVIAGSFEISITIMNSNNGMLPIVKPQRFVNNCKPKPTDPVTVDHIRRSSRLLESFALRSIKHKLLNGLDDIGDYAFSMKTWSQLWERLSKMVKLLIELRIFWNILNLRLFLIQY